MIEDNSEKSKRIAKNTLILYVRMLLGMLVSLYTSRVILNALGAEDFGISSVVGGLVSMFSLFSGSLTAAISRFITFELGAGNLDRLKGVFSSSITILLILSAFIFLLAETVGLWFLNNKMVIPESRMYAANWVFQISIFNFIIGLISIPYNALIIAYERMSAFAWISIIDLVAKLLIAYMIMITPYDRLIFHSVSLAILSLLMRIIYGLYCKKNFTESTYNFCYDKDLLKRMFSFAGWNFIGASSALLRDTGGNLVINLFYGPTVNAARGIAGQINSAVGSFVGNFMVALNPQITKSYASGDREYMMTLIFQGARMSYYILLLLSLPIIINADYILHLWLGNVPNHTVLFAQLTLLFAMSESISNPLVTAMLATDNIKNYQIVVGGIQMLNLPISYVCLYMGACPESVMIVAIILSQCCLASRLVMLRPLIGLQVRMYLKKVYFNVIIATIFAAIIPAIFCYTMNSSFVNFILAVMISLMSTIVVVLYVGCNKKERAFVYSKARAILTRIKG